MKNENIFSTRLREARQKAGLSMKAFGEIVGVSDRAVWNYENGFRYPTLPTACRIAETLQVSLAWLAGIE